MFSYRMNSDSVEDGYIIVDPEGDDILMTISDKMVVEQVEELVRKLNETAGLAE